VAADQAIWTAALALFLLSMNRNRFWITALGHNLSLGSHKYGDWTVISPPILLDTSFPNELRRESFKIRPSSYSFAREKCVRTHRNLAQVPRKNILQICLAFIEFPMQGTLAAKIQSRSAGLGRRSSEVRMHFSWHFLGYLKTIQLLPVLCQS
jgi:hypothetical protein